VILSYTLIFEDNVLARESNAKEDMARINVSLGMKNGKEI